MQEPPREPDPAEPDPPTDDPSAPGGDTRARDEALGRLTDELREARAAGHTVDYTILATKYEVTDEDVRRCAAAVDAFDDALFGAFEKGFAAAEADVAFRRPNLPEDYEIVDEIGRGGMGVVFRARQKSLDRHVAVKVLRPGERIFEDALQRFLKEAKALAKLRHPHIVTIYEVGESDGFVFYTMDLIEGEALDLLIDRKELTTRQAVKILRQVCSAIDYTHSNGIIHRDLKPGNVLLDGEGNAYVADFGLARDRDVQGSVSARLTQSGHVVGTPAYMSPEQARGQTDRISEASDIYALGAILYECLTGREPFSGIGLAETIYDVIHREPVRPRRIDPKIPVDLEVICLKAMEKLPERRYATARAMGEDLERYEEGQPILARPPSMLYRLRKAARLHRQTIGVALGVVVLFLLLFRVFVLPRLRDSAERIVPLADRHHAAGRHASAADTYELALARAETPEDVDEILHGVLRCRTEAGRDLERQGKTEEAHAVYTQTEMLLRQVYGDVADLVMERLLYGIARCRAAQGRLADAEAVVDRLEKGWAAAGTPEGEALLARWTDEREPAGGYRSRYGVHDLLDGLRDGLTGPAGPARDGAMRILARMLDHWSTHDAAREWLFEQGEEAPGLIAAVIPAVETTRASLGPDRDWYAGDSLRHLVRDLSATAGRPALEEALASLAGDATRSAFARDAALRLLALSADLPLDDDFRPGARPLPSSRAGERLRLWRETAGLDRAGSLKARVIFAIRHLEEAESEEEFSFLVHWLYDRTGLWPTGPDIGSRLDRPGIPLDFLDRAARSYEIWLEEVGMPEPPTDWYARAIADPAPRPGDPGRLLDGLARGDDLPGTRSAWYHSLLALGTPAETPVPSWRGSDLDTLAGEWRMVLSGRGPGRPPRHVLVARLALLDGNPEPILMQQGSLRLSPVATAEPASLALRHEFPAGGTLDARFRWRLVGFPVARKFVPRENVSYRASARVEDTDRGTRLLWRREPGTRIDRRDVRSRAGIAETTGAYEARLRIADLTEHAWPADGLHEATHVTVILPQSSDYSFGRWSLEDWVREIGTSLEGLASRIDRAATGDAAGDALDRNAAALEDALRLATLVPIARGAPSLGRLAETVRRTGRTDRFPRLLPARLLAGDVSVLDEPGFDERLARADALEDIGPRYWTRLLLSSREPRVRSLALERLGGEPLPLGVAATLSDALEAGQVLVAEPLRASVEGSRGRLQRTDFLSTGLSTVVAAALLGVAALLLALVAWPGRDPDERIRAAGLLFVLGVAIASLGLEVGGIDLLPRVVGFGLAAVAAGALARGARGTMRLVVPGAFAVAVLATWVLPGALAEVTIRRAVASAALPVPSAAAALAMLATPFLLGALARGQARRASDAAWIRKAFWIAYGAVVAGGLALLLFEKMREQIGRLIRPDEDLGRRLLAVLAGESQPLGALVGLLATGAVGLLLWELVLASRVWDPAAAAAVEDEEPDDDDEEE